MGSFKDENTETSCSLFPHDLNTATRSEHCYGVPWSLCFMCEIVDVESSLDLFERTTIESEIRKYGDCMWSFFCWCCLFLLVSLLNLFLYSTLFHCLQMQLRGMTMSCWWNPMLRSPESHHRYFASALLTQVGQPRAAAVDAAELVIIWLLYGWDCWNLKPPTFTRFHMKSSNQLTSSHQPGIFTRSDSLRYWAPIGSSGEASSLQHPWCQSPAARQSSPAVATHSLIFKCPKSRSI